MAMKKISVFLTLAVVFTMCYLPVANAAIPHLISYQGRLTDAQGTPITGSRAITFRIYDAAAGGNLLWSETHSSATIADGVFEVLLGSVSSLNLPFDKQYYLAIQVGSDPEMTPRQQLASVGYAYKAEEAESATEATNADTVDNFHASSTPEANKLLTLDANVKFPTSVLGYNNEMIFTFSALSALRADSAKDTNVLYSESHEVQFNTGPGTIYFNLPIPTYALGRQVTFSECIVYYQTETAQKYIDTVQIIELSNDRNKVVKVNHIDNLGQGMNGFASHQIVDSVFTLDSSKSYYLRVDGISGGAAQRVILIAFKIKLTF